MFDWLVDAHFVSAISYSLIVMFSVVTLSVSIGLPLGTLAGLYRFRGKRILLGLTAIPLLMPSFLWAIGLSQFQALFNISDFNYSASIFGVVFVFSSLLIPLTIYASLLGVKNLSSHQIDALFMVGSSPWVFFQIAKRVLPVTVLISLLAGIMTLSDPGPGQIFGFSGAAAEILISFSALYDFDLARQQCFIIAGVSLILFIPTIIVLGPYLSSAVLAQETVSSIEYKNTVAQRFALAAFIILLLVIIGIPLVGILSPLLQGIDFNFVFSELQRTWINTLFYSIMAGILSMFFALSMVLYFGQYNQKRSFLIGFSLLFLVLPSSFVALNVLEWSTAASAKWDWLLRGRFLVAAVLGLRFLSIPTLLIINRYSSISSSWFDASKISGVTKINFYLRVLIPYLFPTLALSILVVTLLATADISTMMLLRPPGEDSFPMAIFTVMANASEVKVSSLCFVYFLISAFSLSVFWVLMGRKA